MTRPHPARDTPLQRNQRRSLAYRDVPVTLPDVPVGAARHEIVASLPSDVAATFNAMPENGTSLSVDRIMLQSGLPEEATRQHLATLCAKGLVTCDGDGCARTRPRSLRTQPRSRRE